MRKTPNLVGWPAIRKLRLLDEAYSKTAPSTQPRPQEFPASILNLLSRCAPTTPMRIAKFKFDHIGEFTPPIQHQPRHLSSAKLAFLERFINKMTQSGVLGKGQPGDYLSPVHLVNKLNKRHEVVENEYRCTVDLRDVNACFQRMPCRIPSAALTAASIASYKFKVVVDLKDAFFHLKTPPHLEHVFGITSSLGVFRFLRLIQGFVKSPTMMQFSIMRLVDEPILRIHLDNQIDAVVLSFLDDIGGGTNESCPYHLLFRILTACVNGNLTVVPSSIQIGASVTHLGKLLTARCEVAIGKHHVELIRRLAPPSSAAAARRTVAFFNFFRDCVPQFSSSTVALRLMAHSKPYDPALALSEFRNLQKVLISAAPLRPVPMNATLNIHTDYSLSGLGAVVTWSPQKSSTSRA